MAYRLLENESLVAGITRMARKQRVFAEGKNHFTDRMRAYWDAWQAEMSSALSAR